MGDLVASIDGQNCYAPGDAICVVVKYDGLVVPFELICGLCCSISGHEISDLEVVNLAESLEERERGSRTFWFKAPDFPYTFESACASLTWCVIVEAVPGGHRDSVEIVISPSRLPLRLEACAACRLDRG